jgi:hypothetical protein
MLKSEINLTDKVLSSDSVQEISAKKPSSHTELLGNLDDVLRVFESFTLSQPMQEMPASLTLFTPGNPTERLLSDRRNVGSIYSTFPHLNAALARDERLWVTIAYSAFTKYTAIRWDLTESNKNLDTDYKNHIFMPSTRSAWRNQAISRFWWMGHLSQAWTNPLSHDQVLDTLFINSDLLQSFFGRPGIVANHRVAALMLSCAHGHYLEPKTMNVEYARDHFRKFMKEMDLLIGSSELNILDDSELIKLIDNAFMIGHSNS